MKLKDSIKPVSYVKAHMAEIIKKLEHSPDPIIITQNGEAKAVMVGVDEYERVQNAFALLRIAAMGSRDVRQGRFQPISEAMQDLRELRRERKS
jgi:prevent-host-death family protein